MKKCPICGNNIENYDEICPYCEKTDDLYNEERKKKKICLFFFVILLLVLMLTATII